MRNDELSIQSMDFAVKIINLVFGFKIFDEVYDLNGKVH